MTPQDFCYWLRGAIELCGLDLQNMTPEQAKMVKEHLDLAFTKITSPGPHDSINPYKPMQPQIPMTPMAPQRFPWPGDGTGAPFTPIFGPAICSVEGGIKQTYCMKIGDSTLSLSDQG